jgi:vacuolar-type H+-ATPase catalytic subunit A/Vma1
METTTISSSHDFEESVAQVVSLIGPVAICRIKKAVKDLMMNEIVYVGEDGLFGEITDLKGNIAKVQVY